MEELQPISLSADESRALHAAAVHRARYSILGRSLEIAGNEPVLIERFDHLYHAFRCEAAGEPNLQVLFHLTPPGAPYRWTVCANGQAQIVTDPALLQVPVVVFARPFLQTLTTHFLIHSGCVARDGRAVVISGASGLGKSTLTSHLAAAGWSLLSDEFAPIRRASRTVDPYPLRVGLRPGPGRDAARDAAFISLQFRSEDKKLVAVEDLNRGAPPEPAEIAAILFLTTELTAEVATARRHRGVVRCWFTHWPATLAPALQARFGVTVERIGAADELHWADLAMGDLTERLDDFRACARDHGTVLAMVEYEDFGEKNYSDPPQLLRIPASAGLIELIKRMPGQARNALITQAFGGKTSGLMFEMASALGSIPFYKMTPGRLGEELAAIEAIWRGDATPG